MKVSLIKPQGFCSGVTKAISIARKAKEDNPGKPIYILGMLAHNNTLIEDLTKEGFITLSDVDEIESINNLHQGDVLVFTAHGHDQKVEDYAKKHGLIIYDATCFKVKENLEKIRKEVDAGHQVIYIGQNGHKEANAALYMWER